MTHFPQGQPLLFGAAYYAEYQPGRDPEVDLDLMVAANFTVVRLGESVWSTWEPRDGEFELEWLLPILDGAHRRGLKVILGTPTYAVPPWLQVLHPEIAVVQSDGRPVGWGGRQETDQSHPVYRRYAERVIRKVVGRYADHPAVIGFQVDNEPGLYLAHNDRNFAAFVEWLKSRYGTVERVNDEWGLVYWSHRLSEWAELWRPEGNMQPQYQIEWRRFQGEQATDLIRWEAGIVREYARDDQFITTCISYSRPQISDDELSASLDIASGNPYYLMQDGLSADVDLPRYEEWWHTGPWALYEWADRAYSSKQAPFLVTETNAQSIGESWRNQPPYPGQLKQAALALISRGSRMIEYWHWQALHFGTETYWGAVLPHSMKPGRIYKEISELGATIKALSPALENFIPTADVAMLYSTDTKWSFEQFPPLDNGAGFADPNSYRRIFDSFYRGFSEVGASIRVYHSRQFSEIDSQEFASKHPVLVAAAEYIADDSLLDGLFQYAASGGHLIIGVRTGYGDELARARRAVAPDRLSSAAGVWYEEFTNLTRDLQVEKADGELIIEAGSAGTAWADLLVPTEADVIARFSQNESMAKAAVTTRKIGLGRVTYVATVPNQPFARSIARWATPDRTATQWRVSLPLGFAQGESEGHTITFIHNWSNRARDVTVPEDSVVVETGARVEAGSSYTVEARAVAVFQSSGAVR